MPDDDLFDEPEIISLKETIKIDGEDWDIFDRGDPAKFVDVMTEHRLANGTVYLTFGSSITDGNNTGKIDIACRMRMNLTLAQILRSKLDKMIEAGTKPVDKSKAN